MVIGLLDRVHLEIWLHIARLLRLGLRTKYSLQHLKRWYEEILAAFHSRELIVLPKIIDRLVVLVV